MWFDSDSRPDQPSDDETVWRYRTVRLAPFAISYYDIGVAKEKIDGVPVTDALIDSWSKEAEAGYSVERLRKRGRKPVGDGPAEVVPVRMDKSLLDALTARAERDHVSRSEAIRAAVRDWVDVA
ncbi:ribbon-helix-helix domain-containing protein [Pseudolysinimonas sp.]|uniref:ribbon-helix-helix domain-containing protein n=1 Tax=Pseudolysinimonas sp. TaxID=2680009 RepID=UPI003F7F728B